MPSIEVTGLSKTYKVYKKQEGLKGSIKALFHREYEDVEAVKNISFSISQGELIGFIGPNGAGKTTTLKILSGLLVPTSGSARVLGFTPHERKEAYLKQISLVMGQKNQLFWDLPAIETFNLNRDIYEIPKERFNEVLDDLTEMLDVGDILHQQVRKLSLGQRMKCELISALLHTPKVLFLDEPTIGLDVVAQKNLRQFIKQYNEKYNATIILTSHYMDDVKELAERVIVINDGVLGYDGDMDNLVKKYAKNKIIRLNFEHEVSKEKLEQFGDVTDFHALKATVEVPREDIKEVASKILKELPVEDLDIAEVPVEDIIRQIFENHTVLE